MSGFTEMRRRLVVRQDDGCRIEIGLVNGVRWLAATGLTFVPMGLLVFGFATAGFGDGGLVTGAFCLSLGFGVVSSLSPDVQVTVDHARGTVSLRARWLLWWGKAETLAPAVVTGVRLQRATPEDEWQVAVLTGEAETLLVKTADERDARALAHALAQALGVPLNGRPIAEIRPEA